MQTDLVVSLSVIINLVRILVLIINAIYKDKNCYIMDDTYEINLIHTNGKY